MNGQNTTAAIGLLSTLLTQAATLVPLVQQASAEGRDLTSAELDSVFGADTAARAKLQADIDAAQG